MCFLKIASGFQVYLSLPNCVSASEMLDHSIQCLCYYSLLDKPGAGPLQVHANMSGFVLWRSHSTVNVKPQSQWNRAQAACLLSPMACVPPPQPRTVRALLLPHSHMCARDRKEPSSLAACLYNIASCALTLKLCFQSVVVVY